MCNTFEITLSPFRTNKGSFHFGWSQEGVIVEIWFLSQHFVQLLGCKFYKYVLVCVSVYIYIHINIYVHVCIHVWICMYTCMNINILMYMCIHVYVNVYLYIHMYTYVYICIYTSDKSPHTLPAGTAPCTLTISRLGDCIWVPRLVKQTRRRGGNHIIFQPGAWCGGLRRERLGGARALIERFSTAIDLASSAESHASLCTRPGHTGN